MIIAIDGPDKCGKSHLIKRILDGFEPKKSCKKMFSNRDDQDGFGYLPFLIDDLDSNRVSVWHRSWVSEFIYGSLLKEDRFLAKDPFVGEWLYSRALIGRGGNFILLPANPNELGRRRDGTDFDEDTLPTTAEYLAYKRFAEQWGYSILLNDYKETMPNAIAARKSAYIPTHKIPSTEYIGSLSPIYTFVGKFVHEFDFIVPRPFYNRATAEYFRPFGAKATRSFGYSSVEGFKKNHKRFPHLFKRTFGVGGAANLSLPGLPNLPMNQGKPSDQEVMRFIAEFENMATKQYFWFPKVA